MNCAGFSSQLRELEMPAVDTRTRILKAATDLFNMAGIRGATLDAIAAAAGVTKKTLYYHFRSKDDLVGESLKHRSVSEHDQFKLAGELPNSFDDLVFSLFLDVAEGAADPHWQGCAFNRAAFELAGMPGHPGVIAAKLHKGRLETTLFERLKALGAVEARSTARRLILLLDGAITHCVVRHDPEYALEAGRLALEIISKARLEWKPSSPKSVSRDPSLAKLCDLQTI